ncbi:CRIM1-like protein [Mya arenaria]|uniref:CRIM1-like protein n=1 Tax=Mya arenaria TaxID=6604 RepID=A0ABY7FDK7_MYAAR|nr:CRIM1-like protein [Mya arenaria]
MIGYMSTAIELICKANIGQLTLLWSSGQDNLKYKNLVDTGRYVSRELYALPNSWKVSRKLYALPNSWKVSRELYALPNGWKVSREHYAFMPCPKAGRYLENIMLLCLAQRLEGCLSEGVVYKNNATWREGDCVMCHCVGGRKQCQAEMCVKTCHNPVYVPGRCCPSCETPSVYPDQSSDSCPSLDMCNITCHSGLRQTPDGCHVCKCRPRLCFQDCRYGYIFDEFGQETCDCHAIPPSCPALDACSKDCNHGYRASKKGCPKCRCNKCSPLNCSRKCSHGYQTDRFGCEVCKCQELLWERNCTVNITEYRPGQLWTTEDCHSCRCTHDGSVTCQPVMCPVQTCLFMVNRAEECCPVCLNVSITHVSSKGQPTDRHEEQTTHMTSTSKGVDHAALADMERKYVISLAAVGTLMMILLILVFVLLYLKLKQRHQASWSVAGQDTYCKCPLFIGHSPTLQHKYNINTDLHPVGKIGFETPIMRKFEKTFIDTALKSDSTPEERKSFIEKDNGADEHEHKNVKDFINEDDGVENIESKCKYKDWADIKWL